MKEIIKKRQCRAVVRETVKKKNTGASMGIFETSPENFRGWDNIDTTSQLGSCQMDFATAWVRIQPQDGGYCAMDYY